MRYLHGPLLCCEVAMILAIDMGNSNIKIGCVGNGVCFEERLLTDINKTSMEYAILIMDLLVIKQVRPEEIEGAILSSVVPPLTAVLMSAVRKVTGRTPLLVSSKMDMGIGIRMDHPESVGADILVGHVAAVNQVGTPVIVVNMGTATTITVTDRDGIYQGGAILPGVKISLDTLSSRTAQLPAISLESPKSSIGKNTIDSMRAGILYGNAGAVDGIVSRIEAELGYSCHVVGTGGMARFVLPLCRHENQIIPDLLMDGLYLLYQKNKDTYMGV